MNEISGRLTESQVIHSMPYLQSDAEAYELLWKKFLERDVRIEPARARLLATMPTFEAFGWRASDPRIKANDQGLVSGTNVSHQAIHLLIVSRFGDDLRGRPAMTLLNESLGLALGAYFAASDLQKNGIRPRSFFQGRLRAFAESASLLGVSFRDGLDQFVESPYLGFARAAEDAYLALSESVLHLKRLRSGEDPETSWARLLASIKSLPFYFFSHRYSLSVPTHYVAAYCGLESHDEDRSHVTDCLAVLRDSPSLAGFLRNLESGEFATANRRAPANSEWERPAASTPRPFSRELLADPDHLEGTDPELVDLLVGQLISERAIASQAKTDLIFGLKKRCYNHLSWFLLDSSLWLDYEGAQVTLTQCVLMSGGKLLCQKLGGNRPGMPQATLFAHAFSRQLLRYLVALRTGLSQVEAFYRFRRGLLLEVGARRMLFEEARKVDEGALLNAEDILSQTSSWLPEVSGILKYEGLGQDLLSVAAHCGFESGSEDQAMFAHCLKALDMASSVQGFLFAIAALR